SMFLSVLTVAAFFAAMLFSWVGSMRMSIYGRLSAGFQFNKMWAMIRHDLSGLLRIFGMSLLAGLVIGLAFSIVVSIVLFIGVFAGVAASGGNVYYGNHLDSSMWGMILGLGGAAFIVMLLIGFIYLVAVVFLESIVVRALGYWTRQFDVPAWRGQDDPMPFELQAAAARQAQAQYQQPPMGHQPPQQHAPQAQPQSSEPQQSTGGQPQPHAPQVQPQVADDSKGDGKS
ncbi:MAG: DUF4013 domain-containing protein, partial [Raoultibacter sp.]